MPTPTPPVQPPLHPRQRIIDAIVALLTDATAAGPRVSDTRTDPHRSNGLPAVSVYILSEPVDEASENTAPRELTRHPDVVIAGWVADTSALPVGRAMNALALDIETAMSGDRYLGGTVGKCILSRTEMVIEQAEKADPLVGIVRLTYAVTYRTEEHDQDPSADFARVGSSTRVPGATEDNDAEDVVTILTS